MKSFLSSLNPINIFWGGGHGVYNRFDCLKYWIIKIWKQVFARKDLKVIEVKYSKRNKNFFTI